MIWINRVAQVASTLAVAWFAYAVFLTDQPLRPWMFAMVIGLMLLSFATQMLVWRQERDAEHLDKTSRA